MISHCWEIFPTIILTRKLRFFKTLSLAIPWIGEFEGKKPERLSFKFPRTKNENDSHVTTPGGKKAIQDSSRPSNGVGSTESIPAAQSSETSASTLKKKMMPASFSCTSQQKKWHCCFLEMIRKPLQGDAFQGPVTGFGRSRNFRDTPWCNKNKLSTFESLLPNQIALHSAGSLENESSPKNGKGNQHANPC